MSSQLKLHLTNEKSPRDVGIVEIILAEKLYEIQPLLNDYSISRSHARAYRIAVELGNRLSTDDRQRITTIREGSLYLDEIH